MDDEPKDLPQPEDDATEISEEYIVDSDWEEAQ